MIPRYTLPEMEKIWSEENRFNRMFEIELAVCEALSKNDVIPEADYKKIKQKAKMDIERVKEIEKVTKHDIAAFVTFSISLTRSMSIFAFCFIFL